MKTSSEKNCLNNYQLTTFNKTIEFASLTLRLIIVLLIKWLLKIDLQLPFFLPAQFLLCSLDNLEFENSSKARSNIDIQFVFF